MNGYTNYNDESEVEDDFDDLKSPSGPSQFPGSPTDESDGLMSAENTSTMYTRTGQPFPSPTGTITRWNSEQVADFVANLGLGQYADTFEDQEIDGEALVELTHEDLIDMKVESMGHRLMILRNIYDIKVRQNISIMHDHYVPASADANAPDAHATQDDVARIINQIKLRDERLLAAEEDLRTLREDLNRALEESRRMREDVLPVLRKAKDLNQPLPTPEASQVMRDNLPSPQDAINMSDQQKLSAGLSRKFSTKKLFLGATGKMPSPTIHDTATLAPSQAASNQLGPSPISQHGSQQPSPKPSQLPSPTSPPYQYAGHPRTAAATSAPSSRYAPHPSSTRVEDPYAPPPTDSTINPTPRRIHTATTSTASTAVPSTSNSFATPTEDSTLPAQAPPGPRRPRDPSKSTSRIDARTPSTNDENSGGDMSFLKTFRVSNDATSAQVLPLALRKYAIEEDWRAYSLYIVHGDQERCLGLREKPLLLFRKYAGEGRKPMFMLRKHATPMEGFTQQAQGSSGAGGMAGVVGMPGPAGVGTVPGRVGAQTPGLGFVTLPGGVL